MTGAPIFTYCARRIYERNLDAKRFANRAEEGLVIFSMAWALRRI
jgi:hypothetical protein